MTQLRVVAAERNRKSNKPDPASSILKIKGSEIQQTMSELLMEVVGPYALPYQLPRSEDERWNEPPVGPDWAGTLAPTYFNWRKISIYGGSNEIQKNIIAKAILGLCNGFRTHRRAAAPQGQRRAAACRPLRFRGAQEASARAEGLEPRRCGGSMPSSGCSACRSPRSTAASAADRSRP